MARGGWQRYSLGAVALTALWAAWNSFLFWSSNAHRHRAETAWFIFSAILLIHGVLSWWLPTRHTAGEHESRTEVHPSLSVAALACIAVSALTYWQSFGVGLLSDDFVLVDRAQRGQLVDATWEFVRPLPLAIWSLIGRVVPDHGIAFSLHGLNIVLHGINGWLVHVISLKLRLSFWHGAAAALLFLCAPYNVEAVTWISGVFDVFLATLVLLSVVNLLRAYDGVALAAGVLLALAAVATKETAVVLPFLLAVLVPLLPQPMRRSAIRIAAASLIIVVGYGVWRAMRGLPDTPTDFSGYTAKEMLSRPFGGISYGIHEHAIALAPALALAYALVWPAVLFHAARQWPRLPDAFLRVAAAGAWLLISIFPLGTMFYIGPDLQNSRYLYLGSAMWSIGLVSAIAPGRSFVATPARVAMMVLITVSLSLTILHQQSWRAAAAARDRILSVVIAQPVACMPDTVSGLPDEIDGAYLFRNGALEAVRGQLTRDAGALPRCSLAWDGATFRIAR